MEEYGIFLLSQPSQKQLHQGWCTNHSIVIKKGVPSAESSRSVQGLGKGVSGKPYPCLCNARRPRLEPGTFRSQAVRLYRLHQARPSALIYIIKIKNKNSAAPK